MLDARLMAALFAEGAGVIVPVGTEHCGDCPSGDARPALAAAARTLAKWFGDAAPLVLAAPGDDESEAGAGGRAVRRRALLRRVIRSLAPPPVVPPSFDELAASDDPDDLAPGRPVPYQAALAARWRALAFRPGAPVGATGRTIGEACSGCLICAELCPTGALEADCSASHRVVSFDPALCTNCTLCLKICPMEAITARALRGVESACAGRALLHAQAQRRCPGCGSPFAAADPRRGLCPICENEQEMDEEWLELLGI
jgi:ferredoxin